MKKRFTKNKFEQWFFYFSLLFVFVFFYRISSLSPLAGDDWGYALNGMQGQPFNLAFDFYFTWSGRFFSELYGFIITPHKSIWNILNAFLFTSIYYNALKISRMEKSITGNLLMLFLMFSIKDELRMETYTWLMGTTYVIPLALGLFYFRRVFHVLENSLKLKLNLLILLSLVVFYIGLTMENIAVVTIFANLCFILYRYLKDRAIPIYLYHFLLLSILSFTLLRISPGANARLIRDHQDWLNLSFLQQLITNYPNFIRYTFIENRYLVLVVSGLNLLLLAKQTLESRKFNIIKVFLFVAFVFASLISVALTLSNYVNVPILLELIDYKSMINLLFWPIYIIAIFIQVFTLSKENRDRVFFFILLAGLSNGVMMASPIFGFRSSLYTVYFMMIVALIYLKSLDPKWLRFILALPLLILLISTVHGLNEKYQLVDRVHQIRLNEIEYYQKNPDVKEAWLIRYPIFSIHSGDIEQNDVYHMEVFKKYYGLTEDVQLFFYYPKDGYQ
jgi:hypothetical protein